MSGLKTKRKKTITAVNANLLNNNIEKLITQDTSSPSFMILEIFLDALELTIFIHSKFRKQSAILDLILPPKTWANMLNLFRAIEDIITLKIE